MNNSVIIPLDRIFVHDNGYGKVNLSTSAHEVESGWYRLKRPLPNRIQLTWENHPIILGKSHPCFPDRECTRLEITPLGPWWQYEADFEVFSYTFHPITQIAEKQLGVLRGTYVAENRTRC